MKARWAERPLTGALTIVSGTIAVILAIAIAQAWPINAATQSIGYKEELGLSGQVIVTTTDAQFLAVPTGAQHARIYVEDNPVCYSLGADEPQAAGGGKWPAGFVSKEENDRKMLQRMRLISCTGSGPATVNVYYSRDRRIGDAP